MLLLKAKDVSSEQSLEDMVKRHLLPEDECWDHLSDCLKENQAQTLFIIDGFDEVKQPNEQIIKLLQGKLLSRCHLLITSRPSFMSSHVKSFDSVLLNIGYSADQQVEFVKKFIGDLAEEKPSEEFILKIRNDELVKDLCRNPLHLSILCMLQCDHGAEVPSSNTQLYQQMKEFIMKRTSSKIGLTHEEFIEKCKPLYKIAMVGLNEGRYQVGYNEIEQHIDVDTVQQLCFFSKEVQISRCFNQMTYYSFTHKSFMEYYAAEYAFSKPRAERIDLLHQIQNRSSFHMVLQFLCGLLKNDSEALSDVFELIDEEVYLPRKSEVTMGVRFILDNHSSHVGLRCLAEIENEEVCARLVRELRGASNNDSVGHVCFSLLWCRDGCIDGLVKLCKALDASLTNTTNLDHEKSGIKVTVQMQCISSRPGMYRRLLHGLCSSKHGGYLHIHHIMSARELAQVFHMLNEKGINRQNLHTLELHFLGLADTTLYQEQMKAFPLAFFSLKCLMIHECFSADLLTQLLSLIMPCNSLESLSISQCTLNGSTCKQLCSALQQLAKLTRFCFIGNSIQDEEELKFYEELLDVLNERAALTELVVSHLPSKRRFDQRLGRQISIRVDGDSSVHMFPALTRCLEIQKKLTKLSLCDTYLGSDVLSVLQAAIDANTQLQVLELHNNHVTDHDALDAVLNTLGTLPNFISLNLRGSELNESNFQVLVSLIRGSGSLRRLCLPAWMGSLEYLAEGLKDNTSLQLLELRNLQFGRKSGVSTFAEAVAAHKSLEQLRLGCNLAPPQDIQSLLRACTVSNSLLKLMLINFGLDQRHVHCIGEMLEKNQRIKSLDLRGNQFKEEDLADLSEYLGRRSAKLKFLNLAESRLVNWHPVVDKLRQRVVMLKAEWF